MAMEDQATARSTIKLFAQPLWLGRNHLLGKTILLYSEQGLGNSILFCRYAKLAAELGARVIFEVQKPLIASFWTFAGVTELDRVRQSAAGVSIITAHQ